ncbi:MAG: glycosyltransferase [Nitrospirota bacterium]
MIFNILHVVSRLPVGGVENMIFREIVGYDKNRFHASICCIKEGEEIAIQLRNAGYNVEILNRMKDHGFDVGLIKDLYTIIKKERIHVLRTHQYHANLYGRIAGILAKVPIIIPTFHNVYESPDKPKLHRRLLNYVLAFFTDVLVGVSETVASDIKRFDRVNPQRVKVIYNGIDLKDFQVAISKEEARRMFNLPQNSTIIGTVGRLTEQKGHRYLIEAASQINNASIIVAGDGPLKEELKRLADKTEGNCIFMGRICPEKIPLFLRSLDIFCFPSLWEGFGIALVEAMAAGLPVVTSDIPPLKEVVDDTGILVSPKDTEALAKALKMLIDNPSLRGPLGNKARERARIFSIENTVKTYECLFEEILRYKGLS